MRQMATNHSRREAIRLYREILQTARHITWADDKTGLSWYERIKQQARADFEENRHEEDPEVIWRLLVSGRDYMMQAQQKLYESQQDVLSHINDTRFH